MSPVGLGTKNHCAVKDQQQFSSQSAVRELLRFGHCELLLLEAGTRGWGLGRNPEEGERPSWEAARTREGGRVFFIDVDPCCVFKWIKHEIYIYMNLFLP
jgi:hypothetical protein